MLCWDSTSEYLDYVVGSSVSDPFKFARLLTDNIARSSVGTVGWVVCLHELNTLCGHKLKAWAQMEDRLDSSVLILINTFVHFGGN